MAKGLNGNSRWIIATAASIIASAAVLVYVVGEMKPEVKKNTVHRITDEATDRAIQSTLSAILEEVQK